MLDRRHEDVQPAVARLDAERGAHDPRWRDSPVSGSASRMRSSAHVRSADAGALGGARLRRAGAAAIRCGRQRRPRVANGSGSHDTDSRSGATHGSESSGRRKPIGESPGIRNRCSRAQEPRAALPARRRPAVSRAAAAARSRRRCPAPARRPAPAARALPRLRASTVERIDVDRQPPLAATGSTRRLRTPGMRVLRIDAEPLGQRVDEPLRVVVAVAVVARRRRRSASDRARSARRPAASSSRAPSAAATRRDTTCPGRSAAAPPGAKRSLQPARAASPASRRFVGPERRRCSTRRRPCRRSRRTSARRPSSAARRRAASSSIDCVAQRVDLLPLLVGVRLGDARRSRGCACTVISMLERRPRTRRRAPVIGAALNGSGVRGQRDVPFAGEQARGRVEPDPAGAGQVDLGPGVQVGEVGRRRRPGRRAASRRA